MRQRLDPLGTNGGAERRAAPAALPCVASSAGARRCARVPLLLLLLLLLLSLLLLLLLLLDLLLLFLPLLLPLARLLHLLSSRLSRLLLPPLELAEEERRRVGVEKGVADVAVAQHPHDVEAAADGAAAHGVKRVHDVQEGAVG